MLIEVIGAELKCLINSRLALLTVQRCMVQMVQFSLYRFLSFKLTMVWRWRAGQLLSHMLLIWARKCSVPEILHANGHSN